MNIPDINCDLGENESGQTRASLMEIIDSANISCGVHAGNASSIHHSIELALANQVRIGAHPGLYGEGGRGKTFPKTGDFINLLDEQVLPFQEMVGKVGGILHHIKLHGTLYHATDQVPELAEVFLNWCNRNLAGVRIYARSGGATSRLARKNQIPCWEECFLDRAYESDGSLRARNFADAMIEDLSSLGDRLEHWRDSGNLVTLDGNNLPLTCQTFCLHSDHPKVVEFAKVTRRFFPR